MTTAEPRLLDKTIGGVLICKHCEKELVLAPSLAPAKYWHVNERVECGKGVDR